ncbi:MAG: LysM peptidoglycan-binding domain-containing protein [Chloroflexi bacterium]|nr:LysM peptidoglycan-binding domain-containing protein [Chloroflexota bacterium]
MRNLLTLALLGSLLGAPVQAVLASGAAAPPASAYISGLVGHAQQYPLSCESRSAVDLAAFWGVSVSETNFFNSLPQSDNPDKGFVGPVTGSWGQIPPNAYGVHAKPIAKQLKALGLKADWHKGLSWKDLRNEIAAGRPVIVWVIGGVWSGTGVSYTSNDGHTSTVAAYEHTMIMIGYDDSLVHLVDAGSGRTLTTSVSSFRNSWGVLDNMAVTVSGGNSQGNVVTSDNDNKQEETQNTNNNDYDGETYVVRSGDYLSKIARNLGISWVDLAALNGISYPWVVYAGQVLKLSGNAQANNNQSNNQQQEEKEEEPAQNNNDNEVVASGDTYTVQKGEYLAQIARKFGINWVTIANLNNLTSPYIVYPGQVLNMPGGSGGNSNASNSNNNSSNGNEAQEQDEQITQKPSGDTYVVQRGDYLVALGREWGISWRDIAALNNISYPWVVHPGQVLQVP